MLGQREALYIDGKWVPGRGGSITEVLNPATEDVIGAVPTASVCDTNEAVMAARRAFDDGPWPSLTPVQRAAYLRRFVEAMERHRADLTRLVVEEAGFTSQIAEPFQVASSMELLLDLVDRVAPSFPFQRAVLPTVAPVPGGGTEVTQGVIHREPRGVAVLITPYNAPVPLTLLKLGPALVAGCCVVLKPSPYTPLETAALVECAEEAGFPSGVINFVNGDVDASQALVGHPAVDIISFTGSDAVGRQVMAQAGANLSKVVLELGGKSASVIFPDVDLDRVAMDAVLNFTLHSGQGCNLLTRTLVHRDVHDDLVDRMLDLVQRVTVGDTADPATTMGPLIRERQRERVAGIVGAAVTAGATLATGGDRPAHLNKGFFFEPTLFVDVDNRAEIAQREIFGPVGVVIPFEDEHHAITIANDSPFGLNGSVWSDDRGRALRVASALRVGTVNVNKAMTFSPNAPFGGYKRSGVGREMGEHGLAEYLETKFVGWQSAKS